MNAPRKRGPQGTRQMAPLTKKAAQQSQNPRAKFPTGSLITLIVILIGGYFLIQACTAVGVNMTEQNSRGRSLCEDIPNHNPTDRTCASNYEPTITAIGAYIVVIVAVTCAIILARGLWKYAKGK